MKLKGGERFPSRIVKIVTIMTFSNVFIEGTSDFLIKLEKRQFRGLFPAHVAKI